MGFAVGALRAERTFMEMIHVDMVAVATNPVINVYSIRSFVGHFSLLSRNLE